MNDPDSCYQTGLLDCLDGKATLEGVLRAAEHEYAVDYADGYRMGRRLERDAKIVPDLFHDL